MAPEPSTSIRPPDPDALRDFGRLLFSKLEGAVTAAMLHLGDRLGLFRALAATGPCTSASLAEATGLHERWVREWCANQAAAGLVRFEGGTDGDAGTAVFSLTPEAVAVLTDPDHPAYGMGWFQRLPATMAVLDEMPEVFRSGVGLTYDHFGPQGAAGIEQSFAPWYRNVLVPVALPLLDGVVERLRAGATAVDLGCGAGVAVVTMARAFPASQFHGYDISEHALDLARAKRAAHDLPNAHFHDLRDAPMPSDGSVDLVTTFDCLHDMTDPVGAVAAIRRAIADDGVWLLVDIKARDTFAENVAKNPAAAMMYGISVLSCMSSALSEPGGAGLGTLGLPESRARAMAEEAGFTRFRRLDLDHPVNAFYEIRP